MKVGFSLWSYPNIDRSISHFNKRKTVMDSAIYSETTAAAGYTKPNPNQRPPQWMNEGEEVEIDLNKYPQPVDSTQKIRGKTELLELVVGGLEPQLVVAKGFYFFFYSAFGSLFPMFGLYFKQLGLNGTQAGLLSGIRPLVEYVSAPTWVQFAERKNKRKFILLSSLMCWILFTFPLISIQPEPVGCIKRVNDSHVELVVPNAPNILYTKRRKRDEHSGPEEFTSSDFAGITRENSDIGENYNENEEGDLYVNEETDDDRTLVDDYSPVSIPFITSPSPLDNGVMKDYKEGHGNRRSRRNRRAIPKPLPGISPVRISHAIGYDPKENANWLKPTYSNSVFKKDGVYKVFFLLLLLIIMGEAMSSPAILLADSAVLEFLGNEAQERYGHQRIFGSVGWAIAMFFVGIALDHSTFPDRKCIPLPQEKNYTVCFAIFVVMMGLATLMAWKLNIPSAPTDDGININMDHNIYETGNLENKPEGATHTTTPSATVFAQTNKTLSNWLSVFQHFKTPNCIAFLFVAWLMGFGIGLIFTFLFWHLQDFGGTPTLFGLASVINHISEIFAYFFSSTFIVQFGHIKVLCLGLLCNVLRFLYITVLSNPWWVLPFEFVQGITHAAVWMACCSYIAHNTPPELRQSAQSVLQLLHHGLGRGFGAIIGGLMVSSMGTTSTFRAYTFVCFLALLAFAFLNFGKTNLGSSQMGFVPQYDPHTVETSCETSHLAPHGVPGGGGNLSRISSNSKIHEGNYGDDSNKFEGQPQQQQGGFNPFNNAGAPQQGQNDNQQYFIR